MRKRRNTLCSTLVGINLIADKSSEYSHWVDIDGEQTHYIDQGQGPAMVLIHGLGADVSRWEKNIKELAKNNRVIAIDLLGFGQSSKPDINYRGQVFVDQITSLLEKLNIESATFVGNSMGGWISLLVAEQYPELVNKLILVAPAFVFGLPPGINAEQLTAGASPQTVRAMETYLNRVYFQSPAKDDKSYIERLLKEKIANADLNTVASVAKALENGLDSFDQERIHALEFEVLIIHGDNNSIVPIDASIRLQSLLKNANFEVVKNAGHWPQLEQSDIFLAKLR